MTRATLFLSLCLLLAAAGLVSAQTAATPAPQPETRAFAMTLFGGGNFLGITTEPVTKETIGRYGLTGAARGVAVMSVAENSPAARAGVQKGDVLLRFDGEMLTSVQKLQRLINEAAPEQSVRLTISRNGAEQELTATLARREELPRAESFTLRPGEEFRLNNEDWQKHGVELQQHMEELRKQLDKLPRAQGSNSFVIYGAGRRIGVTTTALTEQLAAYLGVQGRGGVLVTAVTENGPAAKAGLKAGDVITEVAGTQIKSTSDLSRALNRQNDGEVTLNVTRDKQTRTIKLTPERVQPSTLFTPGETFAPPVTFTMPRISVRVPHVVPRVRVITPRSAPVRIRTVVL